MFCRYKFWDICSDSRKEKIKSVFLKHSGINLILTLIRLNLKEDK